MLIIENEPIDLKEYLYIKRMNITEFSELIGYSRTHISQVINKKLKPSKRLAKSIEKITEGKIKASQLLEIKK